MEDLRLAYLELLKQTIIDLNRCGSKEYRPIHYGRKLNLTVKPLLNVFSKMEHKRLVVCEEVVNTLENRMNGRDWPQYADSMIGYKRLTNIQDCVTDVLHNNIEGDLIETGVWRGGAVIFMRAILKAYNCTDRIVWAADSYEGLPQPNAHKYFADKDDQHHTFNELKISLETVKENFRKYDLLDEQVRFLKGWFKDTLPVAPIKKLAVLRLDGDMYESTMDALTNLYPKVSKGGYIIIDDWGAVEGCKLAVLDYRKQNNITAEIVPIDLDGIYWKKL
ncbi:MAG: TylF/MycF family methyltransferase [Bacteroidetes bacterium]|nr:TylF/MycF family methyltransferase [Bacteroidota bacterium]